MNENQKMKTKFRATVVWKKFCIYLKRKCKVDFITQQPLRKGCNTHHLDLNNEHYTDISNEENFIPLNKKTHDTIHFLYNYYRKDEKILNRLKIILDKMKKLNG